MRPDSDRSACDIRRRAQRLQLARSSPRASPLRGFGVFGAVGWAVAVPTVSGAFLGVWLNRVAPQSFSWPIALILAGVVIGGGIAWAWVGKESVDPEAEAEGAESQNEGDDV